MNKQSEKPEWDISSRDGKESMAAWLNEMIGIVPSGLEALTKATNSRESVRAWVAEIEPISRLIDRLNNGIASEDDQIRAAELISQFVFPKPPGPKSSPKHQRDPMLFMVAHEAKRISEVWRIHYGRTDQKMAIEFARLRCLDAADFGDMERRERADAEASHGNVEATLQRAKARNFGFD